MQKLTEIVYWVCKRLNLLYFQMKLCTRETLNFNQQFKRFKQFKQFENLQYLI